MLSKFACSTGTWFKASRNLRPRPTRQERRLRFESLEERLQLDSSSAALASSNGPNIIHEVAADFSPIHYDPDTLTLSVQGSGSDLIQLSFASSTIFYVFNNGVYAATESIGTDSDTSDVKTINFNGGGGEESAELIDDFNNYSVSFGSGSAAYSSNIDGLNFAINVTNCPQQYYYGTAASTVNFSDSTDTAGVNSFVGDTVSSYMYYGADDHAFVEASGPTTVTATSSNTAQDVAYFYESTPIATFSSTPGSAFANFNDADNNAVAQTAYGFGHVLAIGGGTASDVANLQGSTAGTNTYCATQFYSWMDNANSAGTTTYFDVVEFFGTTTGNSKSSGNDFEYLYAPAGTSVDFDNSGLTDNLGIISGEMFAGGSSTAIYTGVGFAITLAVGNSDSTDSAILYAHPDSFGSFHTTDGFVAGGSYGLLTETKIYIGMDSSVTITTTSVTEFDLVTVDNTAEGTGTEFLNSYNYNLQFQGA